MGHEGNRNGALIEVADVTVRFAARPPIVVLSGVTLHLRPGVTLLRGASGAGKSTLLRVLAGLQPLDQGSVRYPWTAGPVQPHVGYVLQENRLPPSLSCEDGLRYLAGVRGLPCGRGDVAALVARWGLAGVRRRRLPSLSSGEARRWLLAQSQLPEPELWLLDEPLHGLDAWGALTLHAELARYAHPSAAAAPRYAVVVSHDPRLDDLATSVWRLERGRVASP